MSAEYKAIYLDILQKMVPVVKAETGKDDEVSDGSLDKYAGSYADGMAQRVSGTVKRTAEDSVGTDHFDDDMDALENDYPIDQSEEEVNRSSNAFALFLFSGPILGIFSSDEAALFEAGRCVGIIAPAFVFYSLATIWQAFFRGAGDTIFPLVVSIVTQFAYRIAAIGPFLSIWPTPSGIWYLYVSSWFLMFALDWAYHKTGFWKKYAKAIKAGV